MCRKGAWRSWKKRKRITMAVRGRTHGIFVAGSKLFLGMKEAGKQAAPKEIIWQNYILNMERWEAPKQQMH